MLQAKKLILKPNPRKFKKEENHYWINQDDLKFYLTYWDEFVIPRYSALLEPYLGKPDPDIEFLYSAKVVRRINAPMGGFFSQIDDMEGWFNIFNERAQFSLFKELEKHHPGQWSIAQSNPQLQNPMDEELITKRLLEMQLYEALPSPGKRCSLDDILRFKEKYSSELQSLRFAISDFYQAIINSVDSNHALSTSKAKIEKKINDIDRAMKGSFKNRVFRGINILIDVQQASKFFATSIALGASIETASMLGGAAGVKIKWSAQNVPKLIGDDLRDFSYLLHIKQNLRG